MSLKIFLFWFQCLLTGRHIVCAANEYTKADFIATAKNMLSKFDNLSDVSYGRPCANTATSSLFYKYVLGIEKTLASVKYDKTKSMESLKNGYNLLTFWRDASGWKCNPSMKCDPPKRKPLQSLNQAYGHKCVCSGLKMGTKEHLTVFDPVSSKCKFSNENSVCSEHRIGILCKEPDYVCLIKNVHLRCTPENIKTLTEYLHTKNIKRHPDDCRCTPKKLERVNITVNESFTGRDYVLAGKQKRGPGGVCADVDLAISQEVGKYTEFYVLPPAAIEAFERMRNNPDIVECDETRQLTCVTSPGSVFGTCTCPLVDYRTGWQNHPDQMVTEDGNCALAGNSDCGTVDDFHFFDCIYPDVCVIMALNVRCTPENWLEAQAGNKWALLRGKNPDEFSSNSSERYLRRCHCFDSSGDKEIYGDFGDWKEQSSEGAGFYLSSWIRMATTGVMLITYL